MERVEILPQGSLGTATACNFDIQSTGSGADVHGSHATLATTSNFAILSSGTGVVDVGGKGVVAIASVTLAEAAGKLATIVFKMAGLADDFGTSLPFLRLIDDALPLPQDS